jgi:hypothetical protein
MQNISDVHFIETFLTIVIFMMIAKRLGTQSHQLVYRFHSLMATKYLLPIKLKGSKISTKPIRILIFIITELEKINNNKEKAINISGQK